MEEFIHNHPIITFLIIITALSTVAEVSRNIFRRKRPKQKVVTLVDEVRSHEEQSVGRKTGHAWPSRRKHD